MKNYELLGSVWYEGFGGKGRGGDGRRKEEGIGKEKKREGKGRKKSHTEQSSRHIPQQKLQRL